MGRDTGGNYTLPEKNPVIAGSIIDSDWANPTMADLAAALTDSLSRTGLGGMTSAFQNADGTVSAPGITFTNELGTGFFRFGIGDLRLSIQGAALVRYRDDSTNPAGERVPLQIWDGLAWVDVGVASENFTQADKDKLGGIEATAQVNPTNAETKTAYLANLDTNNFDDAAETKLGDIEALAEVNPTNAETKTAYLANLDTNNFDDDAKDKLGGIQAGAQVNSGAAGATTQVQFNNAGAFGAAAGLTYNTGTSTLAAANITATGAVTMADVQAVSIQGGLNGDVLQTDGAGTLSWVAQTAGGGSMIKSIQRGTTSILALNDTDVTIAAVDLDKSFISSSCTSGSMSTQLARMIGVRLTSATNLRFTGNSQQTTTTVYWEVIEFV